MVFRCSPTLAAVTRGRRQQQPRRAQSLVPDLMLEADKELEAENAAEMQTESEPQVPWHVKVIAGYVKDP